MTTTQLKHLIQLTRTYYNLAKITKSKYYIELALLNASRVGQEMKALKSLSNLTVSFKQAA